MRNKIILLSSLLIFLALNYGIYKNKGIEKSDDILFLKLAPRDPRSLLRGDYMHLNYALERINVSSNATFPRKGFFVVKADKDNIGHFVKIYSGAPLERGEKLISYYNTHLRSSLFPPHFLTPPKKFFFQEGHGTYYRYAKYGVFKFDKNQNYLLIGLADANKNMLGEEGPE